MELLSTRTPCIPGCFSDAPEADVDLRWSVLAILRIDVRNCETVFISLLRMTRVLRV